MSEPVTGGESVVRHHRAQLVAELDELQQRAARLAAELLDVQTRARLIDAAIGADTNVLDRLTRLAAAELLDADRKKGTAT